MRMIQLMVDIRCPENDEELRRRIVGELSHEPRIERLENLIRRFIRVITGEDCETTVEVER